MVQGGVGQEKMRTLKFHLHLFIYAFSSLCQPPPPPSSKGPGAPCSAPPTLQISFRLYLSKIWLLKSYPMVLEGKKLSLCLIPT